MSEETKNSTIANSINMVEMDKPNVDLNSTEKIEFLYHHSETNIEIKFMTRAEAREMQQEEYLLRPNPKRFVLVPKKDDPIWKMAKKHEASLWHREEITMKDDLKDLEDLKPSERKFLGMGLAFFAASDGIVIENLVERFSSEVKIPEARVFYSWQCAMEQVHSETYGALLEFYISDKTEREYYLNAIETIPSIAGKANWAQKWINSKTATYAERLIAFAVVEGVFFSSVFAAIFWFKKRGLLPGLTFSNELISRDEGLHADFACLLFTYLKLRPSIETVHSIVREAVDVEKVFCTASLPVALIGMNETLMCTYVEFVADRLLEALQYPKIYNVKNPFEWMEMISLQGKTNFFEKRNGDYSISGIGETPSNSGDLESDWMSKDY
jgi:ribonucleoside-diphosphate reductase subunit M2